MSRKGATSKTFDLRKAFLAKQQQLTAALHAGRAIGDHPTTVGDDSELNWKKMLSDFLPSRYGVARAHVIDADGQQSEQVDVVIHDRIFSPLLFEVGGASYIPAESFYAVFEVKQDLNRSNVGDAADKIEAVRTLRRTSVPIPSAMGLLERKDLDGFAILGGIVASRSNWNPPFGDAFRDALAENGGQRRIDLGCALADGGFETSRSRGIDVSQSDTALIFFATRLLYRLQQLGSVPAIDYSEYGAAIDRHRLDRDDE